MRIGIDYWPATTHAPGVGRYVRELVRAVLRLDDAPELRLFDVGPGERTLPASALGLTDRAHRLQRTRSRRMYGPFAADRALGGVDLFHRAFCDRPRVARARELLPVAELPPARLRARFEATCRRAVRVVVFSHALRAELLERLGLPAERVHYLPVGCDHWRRDLGLRSVPPPERPRFLVLGARAPSRRPLAIARAFAALVDGGLDADLVFCGRSGSPADEAALTQLATGALDGRLQRREPVEAELPELVAGSSVLVHLAADERTPVTPLEAFAFGLAVVATPLPAFEEALADEPVWYGPRDPDDAEPGELAAALATALELSRAPERRAARIAIADEFTWHAHARATVALWRGALGDA